VIAYDENDLLIEYVFSTISSIDIETT